MALVGARWPVAALETPLRGAILGVIVFFAKQIPVPHINLSARRTLADQHPGDIDFRVVGDA